MDQKILDFLREGIQPVNIGVEDFGQTLEDQGAVVVYVNWSPPAAGDQEMIDLLDQLL
jgi:hypothetical protein